MRLKEVLPCQSSCIGAASRHNWLNSLKGDFWLWMRDSPTSRKVFRPRTAGLSWLGDMILRMTVSSTESSPFLHRPVYSWTVCQQWMKDVQGFFKSVLGPVHCAKRRGPTEKRSHNPHYGEMASEEKLRQDMSISPRLTFYCLPLNSWRECNK